MGSAARAAARDREPARCRHDCGAGWLLEKGARKNADELLFACAELGRDDALDRTIALAGDESALRYALHSAAEKGHDTTVLRLLALGAPVTERAIENGRESLEAETLKALEAKKGSTK